MLYYEWDYDKNSVTQWERHGECNRCGDCCRICVKYNKPSEDIDLEGAGSDSEYHGICNHIDTGNENIYFWDVRIDSSDKDFKPCESLNGNGCTAHNDTREVLCQYFPMSPRNAKLFKQCSYQFTKIESWDID